MYIVWGVAASALALAGVVWSARAAWRLRVGRAVVVQRDQAIRGHEPELASCSDEPALADRFARESLVTTAGFLEPADWEKLRQEALDNQRRLVRSYVPRHKQGGTVSYETIHSHAPGCLALYHSPVLQRWIGEIVGAPVKCAGDHDQSACSILYYTQPGDYINWHRDPNFYSGRQFTVLLVLLDQAESGGPSASALMRKHRDGREERVELAENSLVLFEGPRVLHKVSPAQTGDTRIALSMTFNTDPRIGLFWELARRVKDTAFYGLKVLWD